MQSYRCRQARRWVYECLHCYLLSRAIALVLVSWCGRLDKARANRGLCIDVEATYEVSNSENSFLQALRRCAR
eukprot:COSAG02_NODE_25782_length_649_cov_0.885455_1_plen_72_part_10